MQNAITVENWVQSFTENLWNHLQNKLNEFGNNI